MSLEREKYGTKHPLSKKRVQNHHQWLHFWENEAKQFLTPWWSRLLSYSTVTFNFLH